MAERRVSHAALYLRLATASIASQMQDRGAFFVQALVGFMVNVVEFLAIALLFNRFGALAGFTLPQLGLLYGLVHVGFALADGVSGGFDAFGNMVRTGDFDRLLLRPRPSALLVAGSDLQLRRIGRLLQGATVLAWGGLRAGVAWSAAKVALAAATILAGACVFLGVFVIQATLAFWTTETLEVMNVLTYGGLEQAQFPLSIYRRGFREFFAVVVPVACASYFPLLGLLERADVLGTPGWFHWVAPAAGPVFLRLALAGWHRGERRYTSTGS